MRHLPMNALRVSFAAAAALAFLVFAPSAQAVQIGYDIIFECAGCGDEPTGMLFIDEAALASDGTFDLDPIGSLMVDVDGMMLTEADDQSFPSFPDVVIQGGEAVALDFFASGGFFDMNQNNTWNIFLPSLVVEGTYRLARKQTQPIPEPNAAMLFSIGSLVVATRIRRRPQH